MKDGLYDVRACFGSSVDEGLFDQIIVVQHVLIATFQFEQHMTS
jgi:hypothetical protein